MKSIAQMAAFAALVLLLQCTFAAARIGYQNVGSSDDMAEKCDEITSESSCYSTGCFWCLSKAVPSRCVSPAQAKKVPPGVFVCSNKVAEVDCLSVKDEDTCHADGCSWCTAGAVPSECVSQEQAKKLPAGVFNCS